MSLATRGPDGDQELVTPVRNYTYNIWRMLATALNGVSLVDLEGKPASEVVEHLRHAVNALMDDPVFYDAMNPLNGWGSRTGCVAWLNEIIDDCDRYPSATFWLA